MTLLEIRDRILALRLRLITPFSSEVARDRVSMKREADLVLEELQELANACDALAITITQVCERE